MKCVPAATFRPSALPSTRLLLRNSATPSQRRVSVGQRALRPVRCSGTETVSEIPSDETASIKEVAELPTGELLYAPLSPPERFWTSCRLIFALPWRRFKKGSVLTFDLENEIMEVPPAPFSRTLSLPSICEALIKAAYDPRVKGIFVNIGTVECGWAKLREIRRHLEFFNRSGKFSVAYLEQGGEKEYFVASAFQEIYVPPSANLYLRGLVVSGPSPFNPAAELRFLTGTYLRGALDKAGLEPQVKRIGNYKSAGDRLLREEMSEYEREQLQALLDDIYNVFVHEVASARDITVESVEKAIEEGHVSMEEYKKAGFFTDLKYKDEIVDMLKERLKIKEKKKKLKRVSLRRYRKVSPSAFALNRGKKAIAIVRASGAISSSGRGIGLPGAEASIDPKIVIRDIRKAADMKNVAAIVLRIDSPGGEALASDLMWHEISKVSKEKPIIASMADLAASGGYYMAMGAEKIVAEDLTLTGSIGVVLAKFGLGELYQKLGITKESISKGRYAEVFEESRSFTEDEDAYFSKIADYAYASFRDKAAESRGMTPEQMQKYAQGRVWSGARAAEVGLVDALGGVQRAIAIARQCAELKEDVPVKIMEMSRSKGSLFDMLKASGTVLNVVFSVICLAWGSVSFALAHEGVGVFTSVVTVVLGSLGLWSAIPEGDDDLWEYTMTDVEIKDSKLTTVLPQAIMDNEAWLASKSLTPVIRELVKKLL